MSEPRAVSDREKTTLNRVNAAEFADVGESNGDETVLTVGDRDLQKAVAALRAVEVGGKTR